tara:strand:+ start:133 stop:519 length:387 start_codon:yes stop_codon:yes gene_type:complete
MIKNVFLVFVLSLMVSPSQASQEIEIGGLLLDNTISRQGREFAYQYSQYWRDVPDSSGFNVQIKEQVIPRSGTKLSVYLNNNVIFVTYLGRRQQPIKPQVESAIYVLLDAMARSQFDENNPDIAKSGW